MALLLERRAAWASLRRAAQAAPAAEHCRRRIIRACTHCNHPAAATADRSSPCASPVRGYATATAPARQMTRDELSDYEAGTHAHLKTPVREVKRDKIIVTDYQAPHLGVIKVVTLKDEASFNALGKDLVREMDEVLQSIHEQAQHASDDPTRVLVVASGMDRAFCAGAHLKERRTMSQDEVNAFLQAMKAMMQRLEDLPVPSIAAVNGAALGGGLELALRTHIRVFAANAIVGLPETRLGILPGAGGTYRLPLVIGKARALDLALTGRRVKPNEALQMGLCTHVAQTDPGDEKGAALREALRVAANIALGGPKGTKAVLHAMSFNEPAPEREAEAYQTVLDSQDRVEALKAFAEKRVPCFTGR